MSLIIPTVVATLDTDSFELSESLKEFLSRDDQGMSGLEFMLNDPKLTKRIPDNVRYDYETLYGLISHEIDISTEKVIEYLSDLKKDPKELIHKIIQEIYEEDN